MVSDSAKFRMTSRKEGMDPVVIALTRGMVMVGDVACAVKGIAAPDLIRLPLAVSYASKVPAQSCLPLGKVETRDRRVHKITILPVIAAKKRILGYQPPECIDHHKYNFVERRRCILDAIVRMREGSSARDNGLVRKESSGKGQ